MATGDVTVFDEFKSEIFDATQVHNLHGTHTVYCILHTNTSAPTAAAADPHYAGTGTTNYATNECVNTTPTNAQYTPGGLQLGGTGATITDNIIDISNGVKFDLDDFSVAVDATGVNDAYWAIIYNNGDTNKSCICFCELGGPVGNTTGALDIQWASTGVFTVT